MKFFTHNTKHLLQQLDLKHPAVLQLNIYMCMLYGVIKQLVESKEMGIHIKHTEW